VAFVEGIGWPALFRAAMLALDVAADTRARRHAVGTWDDLLADLAAPWQFDTVRKLDHRMPTRIPTRAHRHCSCDSPDFGDLRGLAAPRRQDRRGEPATLARLGVGAAVI
jgi:hypothetical protein